MYMKKNRLNDNNFLSELEKNEFKFVTIFVLIKFYFMSTEYLKGHFDNGDLAFRIFHFNPFNFISLSKDVLWVALWSLASMKKTGYKEFKNSCETLREMFSPILWFYGSYLKAEMELGNLIWKCKTLEKKLRNKMYFL